MLAKGANDVKKMLTSHENHWYELSNDAVRRNVSIQLTIQILTVIPIQRSARKTNEVAAIFLRSVLCFLFILDMIRFSRPTVSCCAIEKLS